MEQFLGKQYKLRSSENYVEYLEFLGIDKANGEKIKNLTPVLLFTGNNDGGYTLTVNVNGNTTKMNFKLGEGFDDSLPNQTKVKSTFEWNGNKLTQTQVDEKGNKYLNVMEFTSDAFVTTTTVDGWNGKSVKTYGLIQ